MAVYEKYVQCVEKHLTSNVLTFKSDPDYQYMLEHPNYHIFGLQYLKLIRKHL